MYSYSLFDDHGVEFGAHRNTEIPKREKKHRSNTPHEPPEKDTHQIAGNTTIAGCNKFRVET